MTVVACSIERGCIEGVFGLLMLAVSRMGQGGKVGGKKGRLRCLIYREHKKGYVKVRQANLCLLVKVAVPWL